MVAILVHRNISSHLKLRHQNEKMKLTQKANTSRNDSQQKLRFCRALSYRESCWHLWRRHAVWQCLLRVFLCSHVHHQKKYKQPILDKSLITKRWLPKVDWMSLNRDVSMLHLHSSLCQFLTVIKQNLKPCRAKQSTSIKTQGLTPEILIDVSNCLCQVDHRALKDCTILALLL